MLNWHPFGRSGKKDEDKTAGGPDYDNLLQALTQQAEAPASEGRVAVAEKPAPARGQPASDGSSYLRFGGTSAWSRPDGHEVRAETAEDDDALTQTPIASASVAATVAAAENEAASTPLVEPSAAPGGVDPISGARAPAGDRPGSRDGLDDTREDVPAAGKAQAQTGTPPLPQHLAIRARLAQMGYLDDAPAEPREPEAPEMEESLEASPASSERPWRPDGNGQLPDDGLDLASSSLHGLEAGSEPMGDGLDDGVETQPRVYDDGRDRAAADDSLTPAGFRQAAVDDGLGAPSPGAQDVLAGVGYRNGRSEPAASEPAAEVMDQPTMEDSAGAGTCFGQEDDLREAVGESDCRNMTVENAPEATNFSVAAALLRTGQLEGHGINPVEAEAATRRISDGLAASAQRAREDYQAQLAEVDQCAAEGRKAVDEALEVMQQLVALASGFDMAFAELRDVPTISQDLALELSARMDRLLALSGLIARFLNDATASYTRACIRRCATPVAR